MPRFGAVQYWGAPGPAQGQLDSRTFTAPGLGTNFFVTLPANEIWQPLSIHYRLVTNAVAGNRRARFEWHGLTGATIPMSQPASYAQSASTTVDGWFNYAGGLNLTAGVAYLGTLQGVTGIGQVYIAPGSDMHVNVDALNAGDQISLVEGTFLVWLV